MDYDARPRTATQIPTAMPIGPSLLGMWLTLLATTEYLPAWARMWLLAGALFFGGKWLEWRRATRNGARSSAWRHAAYFFGWAGMDAAAFLDERTRPPRPPLRPWLLAAGNVLIGVLLLWVGVTLVAGWSHLAAEWIGWVGLGFVAHVGVFQLLSLAWRTAGVQAEPIMNFPIAATSLSDFWGRRWNLAFHRLAVDNVYRPLVKKFGGSAASWTTFLVSGLVHDAVVSIPARGGYGLPTAYFLLQAAGVSLAHSRLGRRLRLNRGIAGRLFTALIVILPVGLLFHRPFMHSVVGPFLQALGCW
jgi:alginate O-acetyltransferase complex protein AlgI